MFQKIPIYTINLQEINMRIRIVRKRKNIVTENKKVDLGRIDKDPSVELYDRWRTFLNSLSKEDKRQVRRWACPDRCSPRDIDRLVKATKGTLEKALK